MSRFADLTHSREFDLNLWAESSNRTRKEMP